MKTSFLNLSFNFVSLLFLALTVIVIVVTIGVMTDRMDPPILAIEPTNVPPTPAILPTMTPSPTPEHSPTPLFGGTSAETTG